MLREDADRWNHHGMSPIDDLIEDEYQDAMDIIHGAIGRERGAWYSRVFGAMRDVAIASLAYQELLEEHGPLVPSTGEGAAPRLRNESLRLIELLEHKDGVTSG
jgi:hypothetical protein